MLYCVYHCVAKFILRHAAAEVEGLVKSDQGGKRRKKKKIKDVQEEERKKVEGASYEAGGAALPTWPNILGMAMGV